MTWEVIHGDCRDVLPKMRLECYAKVRNAIDAVVTDPPYGIALRTDFASRGCGKLTEAHDYPPVYGDDKPFDPSPWLVGFEKVCLFGANYFADRLPPSGRWLVWYKRDGGISVDQADAELAWTNDSGGTVPRVFHHEWMGMLKKSERDQRRCHPTQKPVALMRWVLDQMKVPAGATVLDPFCGSGSTGVACVQTDRNFIGIEIDAGYCAIARKRIAEAANHLFAATT